MTAVIVDDEPIAVDDTKAGIEHTLPRQWVSQGLIVFNLLSSVGLVALNKKLLGVWPHSICLASVHSLCTFIATRTLYWLGFYEYPSELPRFSVAIVAGLGLLSVTTMNANLRLNYVGVYQGSRLCVLPVTSFLEWLLWGKRTSVELILLLFLVVFGVFLSLPPTVVSSFWNHVGTLTSQGLALSIFSTFASSLAVMQIGRVQKVYNVSPLALLDAQQHYIITYCVVATYLFDDVKDAADLLKLNTALLPLILSTGLFAVAINTTGFVIIKSLTSVSYQVLNHLKIVSTFAIGYLVFKESMNMVQWIGVSIAMGGMVAYTDKVKHDGFVADLVSEDVQTHSAFSKQRIAAISLTFFIVSVYLVAQYSYRPT